jgi:quinoprotein glucose dehydrogenase
LRQGWESNSLRGYIHAFDKDTGKTLWETEIAGTPDGILGVYEVGGREYVALFAAGGSGDGITVKKTKPEAEGYYVFALPLSDLKAKKSK